MEAKEVEELVREMQETISPERKKEIASILNSGGISIEKKETGTRWFEKEEIKKEPKAVKPKSLDSERFYR